MSNCPPNCRHCADDLLHGDLEHEAEEADAMARIEAHDRDFDEDDEDFEALGRRIALEGMDLSDGAYFAMAEELGLEP